MHLKESILSLVLLCLIAGGRSETQCAFSIPALLKSKETSSGCLGLKGHTEPIKVDIVLEVDGVNNTILSQQVPLEDTFKCSEFKVPNISSTAPVFLSINAVGTNYNYTARTAVVVAPTGKVTLIQLERSIYKPGQTVHFNVIALDNNLQPVEDTYPSISVTDPSGNRHYQWINQKTDNGFLTLSFKIPDDPELGRYQIQVETESRKRVSKSMEVDEYVMPNFRVEVSAPNSITILDKSLSYTATSTYTYDQAVPGNVTVRACRAPMNYYSGNACNRNPDGLCVSTTGTLDTNGTFSGEFDMTSFQFDRSGYQMAFNLQVTVTEEGSGIQVTESKFISITNLMARVYFNRENMDGYYKKRLPFYVEITAVDGLEKPLKDQTIELQVNGITVKNLTTDDKGKARDYIDTSEMEQSVVNIQVIYKNPEQCYDSNFIVPTYSNDYLPINRFYSKSESFVHMTGPKEELQCGQTYTLTAKYIFSKSGLQEGEKNVAFNYMVMSRSKITNSGNISADLTNSLEGEFTITITITPDHVPSIAVIVYCMLEKEVVTHSIQLNTEKCFSNQVSLQFSEERATPGSTVNLNITSAPRSLCAVRIYDSGLLLLKEDQPLTPAMVYSSLQYNSLNGYYIAGYNVAPPARPCISADKQILVDGLYYSPVDFPNEGDASQQFSSIGMLLITDTPLMKPTVCGQPPIFGRPTVWADGAFASTTFAARPGASFESVADPGVPAPIESVRTKFPEMWLFNQTNTGNAGSISIPMEVPGTITKWQGDMVCLGSEKGFGMTKYPANLTSFQVFFVSASLPYSIVRTEILILKVVVALYVQKCAQVRATVEPSNDYTVEPMDKEQVKCVCFGQRASFSFSVKAKSLGEVTFRITGETVKIGDSCEGPADPNEPPRKDTIVQSIIVEAEGIPKEVTKSTLVCVKDASVVVPVNIIPPENAVNGSVKAKVTVIGDILGGAIVNPESMIRDPTGCGEQKLATLAVLPMIVDYMNKTGRLTESIESKAVQFMGNGYRGLLPYRNSDGSFSAFANGKSSGSSWLTLLILKCLILLKPYFKIPDDNIFNQGLVYLERLKNVSTGGFTPQGTVFNSGLKGGAEDDVSFTAAMTVFLLRAPYAATPTLLRESLTFLDDASRREQSVYNMAYLFYVFRLAGNEERSNAMLNKLKELQIVEEGSIHWERPNKPKNPTSYIFSPHAESSEIEITAVMLLGHTAKASPTPDELNYMSQIVLWLSRQQRAYGSYSTTADTVMAIQAMCAYGALVYQKNATNSVEVKYGEEVVKVFNLDSGNRDLLQNQPLSNIPGNYSIAVSGNGCVLVQTTVNLNVPVNVEDSAFQLSVYTPPESCVNGVAYTIPVYINVSYNGLRNESNMALIDLALPSGYSLEYQSLMQLRREVSKVEVKNNHIIIYFASVSRKIILLKMTLQMGVRVQNHQSSYIYAWDYYEKAENGIAVLRHPCSTQ